MKTKLISFVILFLFSCSTFAQIEGKSYANKISGTPIYNKSTGILIKESEIREMVDKNPNIIFEPIIDKYGNIESFQLDPFRKDNILKRDILDRVERNEKFPPFVMKSLNNKIIKSENLKGKIVLIQFQLQFVKPFFNINWINEFNNLVEEIGKRTEIEAIIVTESTKNEIELQLSDIEYIPEIIPDGRNFNHKYLIVSFPTIVLIDKEGNLVSYYEQFELEKLKSDIEKLI